MPGGDGTGPSGRGPMTGWGMGPCGRGRGRGYGFGYGGRGRGRWGAWDAPPRYAAEPASEKEYLEGLAKELGSEVKEIQKRLKELK